MKYPVIGHTYFRIDSTVISSKEVKFYRNTEGLYANTMTLEKTKTCNFIHCIAEGPIRLYEREKTITNPGGHFKVNSARHYEGSLFFSYENLYNRGFGDLRKAYFKTLSLEMIDDPQSMYHLNQYQLTEKYQHWLAIAGAISIAGIGLMEIPLVTDNKNARLGINIVITAGIFSSLTSYWLYRSKRKHLHKAVRTYNQNGS